MILGVNSSYSGSHLPSQYESNPSGGTHTMLILLQPLLQRVNLWNDNWHDSNTCEGIANYFVACKIVKIQFIIVGLGTVECFFYDDVPSRYRGS